MADTRSTSDSSDDDNDRLFGLPKKYKFLKILGEGSFGTVLKCSRKNFSHPVAVKVPKVHQANEASLLRRLMSLHFDHYNIIKYYESFHTKYGEAMVFESLDKTLQQHIVSRWFDPMELSHIRSVVQQVATALDALKSIGIIHTDVKLDNIMLVDQQRQPFKIKLIDFGLALHRSKVKRGMVVQPVNLRAPEVILGNQFSEAIDIWALGFMMVTMITGSLLNRTDNEYDTMNFIVEILGQPPDHLLNDGKKTNRFFNKTCNNRWKLKTRQEAFHTDCPMKYRNNKFKSLDDLKKMRLEKKNKAEARERHQCIELLKAMLKLDPNERITPSEVLQHPFITNGHINKSYSLCGQKRLSHLCGLLTDSDTGSKSIRTSTSSGTSGMPSKTHMNNQDLLLTSVEFFDSEPAATTLKDTTKIQPDQLSPQSLSVPPSDVIMVRPVLGLKSLTDSDTSSQDKSMSAESSVTVYTPQEPTPCDDIKTNKKGKKSCIQHFLSCIKKLFSC